MNLKVLRKQSLQVIGEILATEQDDDFFRETIAELLMKIKLVYPGLTKLEEESILLLDAERLLEVCRDAAREAEEDNRLPGRAVGAYRADELYREQQTETRRAERVIEDEIALRKNRK